MSGMWAEIGERGKAERVPGRAKLGPTVAQSTWLLRETSTTFVLLTSPGHRASPSAHTRTQPSTGSIRSDIMAPNDKAGRVVFIGNIPYGMRPYRRIAQGHC